MCLFAKFLQFIKLLFDFMNVVLTICKHFSVNSFKIINITNFEAANFILMITKYYERFGFYFSNKVMYFFVYLVTADTDFFFFCMIYNVDENFDENHPREIKIITY